MRHNEFGQPVGPDLGEWVAPEFPPSQTHSGSVVELVPLDAKLHSEDLMAVFADVDDSLWTYLPFGPLGAASEITLVIDSLVGFPDWQPFAVVVEGKTVGFLSYLRIDPRMGTIEIGSIVFAPGLARTTAATEAIFLLIDHCFALGYRRCEWKCDDLNAPSRAAAERFGFIYEGTFRLASHYKGRSRDTAWFAITINNWPHIRAGFVAWLSSNNFDAEGHQRQSLAHLRKG